MRHLADALARARRPRARKATRLHLGDALARGCCLEAHNVPATTCAAHSKRRIRSARRVLDLRLPRRARRGREGAGLPLSRLGRRGGAPSSPTAARARDRRPGRAQGARGALRARRQSRSATRGCATWATPWRARRRSCHSARNKIGDEGIFLFAAGNGSDSSTTPRATLPSKRCSHALKNRRVRTRGSSSSKGRPRRPLGAQGGWVGKGGRKWGWGVSHDGAAGQRRI